MQNNQKSTATRRIDLSKCKLLSTYGRDLAESAADKVKVGTPIKTGVFTKIGGMVKFGFVNKPDRL